MRGWLVGFLQRAGEWLTGAGEEPISVQVPRLVRVRELDLFVQTQFPYIQDIGNYPRLLEWLNEHQGEVNFVVGGVFSD